MKGRAATLLAGIAGTLALAVGLAGASTPPTSSITVPSAAGQTVSVTWTGTIPPGANPTNACTAVAGTPLADEHSTAITVPPGLYNSLNATFTFSITWGDALHDEILTVLGPGGTVVGSSDGGTNVETVIGTRLQSGTYRVLACPFAAAVPVTYTGKLEIRTEAGEASLPSAPADGLEFSASVAADNQRDESEPLVEIDRAGNIYACGPTGSSQLADYIQVSTDGGDSFHLLGTPPRGQAEGGGGGDCAVALGHVKNSRGNYDLAMSGLGPLTGFATSISPNYGRSFATGGGDVTGGITNQGGVADRQWQTFVDANTVLLAYNHAAPRNTVVLRSTDKGLTFNPAAAVIAAASPLFPGPMRYDDARNLVYFGWDATGTFNGQSGDFINLSVSRDRGLTWQMCVADFVPGEVPGFVSTDNDSAGNIYIGYGDSGAFHTYMKSITKAQLEKCDLPASTTTAAVAATQQGVGTLWGPRIQVDRDAVRTTVFPWLTAGGAPGRVAFMFAGTETQGDPNGGDFKASWNIYGNISTNALSPSATFSQVKATTHPFHYDSICLNGLGCDLAVPPGDRTMADFLAIDYNPVTGKTTIIFDRTNKKPDEEAGHVASTMAVTQNGGPSLGGGSVSSNRPVVRTSSTDPSGDALSLYSVATPGIVPPDPASANEPAADYQSVSVGPEIDFLDGSAVPDGGFTVTMKVADLSTASLQNTMVRTQSQSLLWVFRFTNGWQDVAASARWNPVQGFTFGYNDYTTGAQPCQSGGGVVGGKCILYPGGQPIPGSVDQATNTIRLSVPRYLLRSLTGSTGHGERPSESAAAVGTRFYDATAWSLGNTLSPVQDLQSFLYPLDNAPSMDFVLAAPGGGGGGGGGTGCKVTGGGAIPSAGGEGKFNLSVHANPKGKVDYRDAAANIDFRSTTISQVICRADGTATIQGTGLNGTNGTTQSFKVDVDDNGNSGDTFGIVIGSYSKSGSLTKGNVTVHQ